MNTRYKRSLSIVCPAGLLLLLLSTFLGLGVESGAVVADSASYGAGPTASPSEQADSAQAPALVVTASVGLEQDACAVSSLIRVAPGTRVFRCYRATNTGPIPLTTHSVEDSQAGLIWDRQNFVLAPGASLTTLDAGLSLGGRADNNTTVNVTWTASALTPTLVTSATSETRVLVMQATAALTKTVGVRVSGCAQHSDTVVPDGATTRFCIVIANTGNMPLVRHTLADPALALTTTFAYTLSPAQTLTLTHSALPDLGIDGSLMLEEVTRSLTNTVYYTATTPPNFAATGVDTASGVATATVSLAEASVRFTATVGTDPSLCSGDVDFTVSGPGVPLYNCAILHNTGNVTITRHTLAQPERNRFTEFERTLAPGEILSVTNGLLQTLGGTDVLGPFTLADGTNLTLNNVLVYTGTTSLDLGREGETRTYTTTVSASSVARTASTPSPTPTWTFTPRPTSTGQPPPASTATPTWTPASPLPTPDLAGAQQATPAPTPTPTRSYAISLLETPTSPALSPLATPTPPVDAAATEEAQLTLAALTATSAALSPLATPSPTESATPFPTQTVEPTATVSPTADAIVIVVTNTPEATPGVRPIELPPPAPTPDYLLIAARAFDSVIMTATWIWFAVGSLVFFVVAGVLAGLSFRQNERQRYDLLDAGLADAGLVEHYEFLLPPPPSTQETEEVNPDGDDWPDSLP